MTTARSLVVDATSPGYYNCTSRCVRRAFLCGDAYEHRRDWILDRLIELDEIFAVDVCAYAVLHNHLHTLVYTDPGRAAGWSAEEVVRRWVRLFPKCVPDTLDEDKAIERLVADTERVETWRCRLSSLSWFMKCLKEPISRRANLEDECTGTFWEGRFYCQRVVDDAGILATSLYVDLNVIRAAMAPTPEASDYASVQDRIVARQEFEVVKQARQQGGTYEEAMATVMAGRAAAGDSRRASAPPPSDHHAEDAIWLKPIENRGDRGRGGMLPITLDQYLSLVDTMGRMVREGARGAIPQTLRPILERLSIDVETWIASLTSETKRIIGSAIGLKANLIAEAARRGCSRVWSSMRLDRA